MIADDCWLSRADVSGGTEPTFGYDGVVHDAEDAAGKRANGGRAGEEADHRTKQRINTANEAALRVDANEHLPAEALGEFESLWRANENRQDETKCYRNSLRRFLHDEQQTPRQVPEYHGRRRNNERSITEFVLKLIHLAPYRAG